MINFIVSVWSKSFLVNDRRFVAKTVNKLDGELCDYKPLTISTNHPILVACGVLWVPLEKCLSVIHKKYLASMKHTILSI